MRIHQIRGSSIVNSPEDIFERHVVLGNQISTVAEGGAKSEKDHRLRQTPRDAVLHRFHHAAPAKRVYMYMGINIT